MMLTDKKIMEIAKPFIKWCGDYGPDEAIPDDGSIQKFARKIEKEILENSKVETDCPDCGAWLEIILFDGKK